jgi:hypothetical protein
MTSGALYHLVATSRRAFSGASIPALRSLTFRQFQLVPIPTPNRLEPPRQPKVADLELAIRIDQQISRFQIAVDHVCRVDVLRTD